MLCDAPARFGLPTAGLGGSAPRIVELGAGTGLVSLTLAQLLPGLGLARAALVATDYHSAVIANLRGNIAINSSAVGSAVCPVQACVLDWGVEEMDPAWPLGGERADVLFATDVIYAHEHAEMLGACASRLLAPDGVFWLLQTVRQNGRFGGVVGTVEGVFGKGGSTGRILRILESQRVEKPDRVGRGDEALYRLFKIGWSG
ncbi:hypothetical protein B0H67DRAFT_569312 [Lasiosphaeris hirsuta]|uniref:Methyltransferase domain-containing protein n=1 Tax=Lasiosphaeris hirsuta TaxID=260670 RepID=A0AA40AZX1_9PEZI|nr:hypothetical protein B0H67DRAFT_569312 [Lasiosphaeris hirsuta]